MQIGNFYESAPFEKIKAEQVYREQRFQVTLIRMKEGELLKPHQSPTDVFLTLIEGEVIFTLNESPFHLKKGDMFTFRSNEMHSVKALKDALLMLVK